jgi:ABC-2 type transport system ATP-binding protein
MTLLVGNGLTHFFGDQLAVSDVDIVVSEGEVVGLLGANGSGKTTTIRIGLGLLRPARGLIELFGEAPSRRTRRRLGYVPQRLGLYEDLTVEENLAFSARAFGRDPRVALEADLEPERGRLVRDLSLGIRRRVAFAAALAHDPDLLVLDEPTSGVGPLARARLWDTVRASAERGAGVLVTTHSMSEAEQCDRLVVLVDGRVAATGSVAEIVAGRQAVEVSSDRWQAAFEALDAGGLPVAIVGRRIRVPSTSLDDVRARLTSAGVEAQLRDVPATFEEAFVVLATSGSHGTSQRAASPAK